MLVQLQANPRERPTVLFFHANAASTIPFFFPNKKEINFTD